MIHVQVRAVAIGDDYLVECSDCGPIGGFSTEEVDEACIQHLETHSVDTTVYRERQKEGEAVEDETELEKEDEE